MEEGKQRREVAGGLICCAGNYEALKKTLITALEQTRPLDKIVIVDDDAEIELNEWAEISKLIKYKIAKTKKDWD